MNLDRVIEIIEAATTVYRKGPQIEEKDGVTEVWLAPHVSTAPPHQHVIDIHFIVVGIDMAYARPAAHQLHAELSTNERFRLGPSYIEVGALLGSQNLALRLFALGEFLNFWTVITPERMGISGDAADKMAGMGMIMPDSFKELVNEN